MLESPATIQAWQQKGLDVMNAGKPLAQLKGDATPILERLKSESAKEIAESLGITRIALYDWLLRTCPDKWQAMSAARNLDRISQAEDTFDSESASGLDVTRARESARLASWQLERVSRIYAAKQEINQGVQISVTIANPLDAKQITVHEHDDQATTGGALLDIPLAR